LETDERWLELEKIYFEDYKLGETFVSPGRTITEADIVIFSALTGDWHPLHTNVEFAAKTEFKERIAHGMLGLIIGTALVFRLGQYVTLPKKFVALYGIDSIRFRAPIRIGDTIHCENRVSKLEEKNETQGIIEQEQSIRNQRGDAVITLKAKILAGRKPLAKNGL
jgi:3-hydroxybutyryl-CoA dehydratase